MDIRALAPADAAAFQALRLRGLREAPTAFTSSYEDEAPRPLEEVARRLSSRPDGATFGAFDHEELIGVVGVQREAARKLGHKAYIWGMYVEPEWRNHGIGRRLLHGALDCAATALSVSRVTLGVNCANTPAVELYKSVGFTAYGVERGFLCVDGVLYDHYHMVYMVGGRE